MNTASFFDCYFNNAKLNSILVMDSTGVILRTNQSFTDNFGYSSEEIKGRNFDILFNKRDREKRRPELELETVLATGNALDENYVINKEGQEVWATGESLLVLSKEGAKYIVKDIVNLESKKQLQLFLIETEELLGRIFESSGDTSIVVLDGSMKILKANAAFLKLFEIDEAPPSGSSLTDLGHPLWSNADLRQQIRNSIVTSQTLNLKEFLMETKSGEKKTIRFDSKIINGEKGAGKKIYLIIQEVTPD